MEVIVFDHFFVLFFCFVIFFLFQLPLQFSIFSVLSFLYFMKKCSTMLVERTVHLFKYTMVMLCQCILSYQVELNNEQSHTSKYSKHYMKLTNNSLIVHSIGIYVPVCACVCFCLFVMCVRVCL